MKLIFCVFIGLLLSCSTTSQTHDVLLKNHTQFKEWSSRPLYTKYGQVSALKVVYDFSENKLHFISSEYFDYHYEYCVSNLGYLSSLDVFNQEAYSSDSTRQFLLANINYYAALDKYTLELGPSDRMNVDLVKFLFDEVKKEVFFSNNLYLMLNTLHVNELKESLVEIPFITPSEIYDGQVYQPISKHKSNGRLVVISDWESQVDTLRPTDIVLVNTIPEVFPLLAGVIVTDFQTPLSHVSLLGQNRKIPICAYTKAYELERLHALNGETVEFSVLQDTFTVVSKDIDLTKGWKRGKLINLNPDYTVDSLIPIQYLKSKSGDLVGNKASNFGLLYQYSHKMNFKTPESAFAIPFYYYQQHAKGSGVVQLIETLSSKENLLRSRAEIEKELTIIRKAIISNPVDTKLINEITTMIYSLGEHRRLRFRSSTNAEDRADFSGAGLYTSKTVKIGDSTKTIAKALKAVWVSLWSYNAFMEREAFHINHNDVAMGVLVHRSFPNEEVNGVAITTNLYRNNYLGFIINAQLGDVSVVQPENGVECDQFICYPDETTSYQGKEEGGIDIINYSSLNNGKLVMTKEEIQSLANVLELIKKSYTRKHYIRTTYLNFGLDIEFKLDENTRELYIKQMRLYNH